MAWYYLIIAGLFEAAWAIGLKYTEGWTKPLPSILTGIAMIIGLYFLSLAVRNLPIGTAYAIWTGMGTVLTVVYGIVVFKEPVDFVRILCIIFIIAGIIGLKIFSK